MNIADKINGIGASRGIAIGKVHLLDRSRMCILKYDINETEVEREIQRFNEAVSESLKQLNDIKEKAKKNLDSKYLCVMDGHIMILQDELLVNETKERVRSENINIEWAFQESMNRLREAFMKIEDEYLRERERDIEHVGNLVLRNLLGHSQESIEDLSEKSIVVSHDITPSDVVQMKKDEVLGFVTEAGGKTSHVSIMASSFEIPAVVGLKEIVMKVNQGDSIIIDGGEGCVILNPSKEEFKKYLEKQQAFKYYENELLKTSKLEAETKDGFSVKLMANIETNLETPLAQKQGAEGVGLFRTEWLFLNREDFPSEEEQFQLYKDSVESFDPNPVVIRTLDVGGDKVHKQFNLNETNPALGLRAIRYSLNRPEVFKTQIRAILRAANFGNLKIMLPLVTGVEEIRTAREIIEGVREDLIEKGSPVKNNIQIGVMIETPSAAVIADMIAKEVDFFSIGTNDLIQYVLAVDRTNETVAPFYQPLHPSVLRLIQIVLKSAEDACIEVGICGEMGGDPVSALILLGLGNINSLSMDSHSIPKIKKMIRNISLKDAREISKHILSLSSYIDINNFINAEVTKRFPDDIDFAFLN